MCGPPKFDYLARRPTVAAGAATATLATAKATTTATTRRALTLVAATATAATPCATLGHHVHTGAHRVGLAAGRARHTRLAGEILHGRVGQRVTVLVRTRIMGARGLVFMRHRAVVVTWESGVAGEARVTRVAGVARRTVRAVAARTLARRAGARAIAWAISGSIT